MIKHAYGYSHFGSCRKPIQTPSAQPIATSPRPSGVAENCQKRSGKLDEGGDIIVLLHVPHLAVGHEQRLSDHIGVDGAPNASPC